MINDKIIEVAKIQLYTETNTQDLFTGWYGTILFGRSILNKVSSVRVISVCRKIVYLS